MRLIAVQQVPELIDLGRHRAAAGMILEAQYPLFQSPVPYERSIGRSGIDFVIELRKITLRDE